MKYVLIALVMIFAGNLIAQADTLITTSGTKWEGKVSETSDGQYYVVATSDGGSMKLPKTMVQEVKRGSPSPTTAPGTADTPTTATASAPMTEAAKAARALRLFELGDKTSEGRGVPPNNALALKYFKEAGELGHPVAAFCAGIMLEEGKGTAKNMTEAMKWYEVAANAGHGPAASMVGEAYLDGKNVAKDPVKGIYFLKKAARAGEVWAMLSLSQEYDNGESTAKDLRLAKEWQHKAAITAARQYIDLVEREAKALQPTGKALAKMERNVGKAGTSLKEFLARCGVLQADPSDKIKMEFMALSADGISSSVTLARSSNEAVNAGAAARNSYAAKKGEENFKDAIEGYQKRFKELDASVEKWAREWHVDEAGGDDTDNRPPATSRPAETTTASIPPGPKKDPTPLSSISTSPAQTPPIPITPPKALPERSAPEVSTAERGSTIAVLNATYSGSAKSVDVTQTVKQLLEARKTVTVEPEPLRTTDIAPMVVKVLATTLKVDDFAVELVTTDAGTISVVDGRPARDNPISDIEVITAYYAGGGKSVDVTQVVKDSFGNGKSAIVHGDFLKTGDIAPGVVKKLTVTVRIRKLTVTVTANDGGHLLVAPAKGTR